MMFLMRDYLTILSAIICEQLIGVYFLISTHYLEVKESYFQMG